MLKAIPVSSPESSWLRYCLLILTPHARITGYSESWNYFRLPGSPDLGNLPSPEELPRRIAGDLPEPRIWTTDPAATTRYHDKCYGFSCSEPSSRSSSVALRVAEISQAILVCSTMG